MKKKYLLMTVFLTLTLNISHSFSFDCPPLKLWEVIIKSDIIIHGTISDVSDSTFSIMPDEVISGNADPDQYVSLAKGAEQNDSAHQGLPTRFRKYTPGDTLLLFLRKDLNTGLEGNIGCYFESELIPFSDSVSFSPFRQDSSVYCRNCHLYNYDSLIRAVKLIKRHYSFDENNGYQLTSEVSDNELKATGRVAAELVKQIQLSPKPKNVPIQKSNENSKLSNFGRIIAIIATVAIAGVVIYEMK